MAKVLFAKMAKSTFAICFANWDKKDGRRGPFSRVPPLGYVLRFGSGAWVSESLARIIVSVNLRAPAMGTHKTGTIRCGY